MIRPPPRSTPFPYTPLFRSFTPPSANTAMTLPAFCRVEATARPTPDSEIKFEVWIPPADAWNGKLEGVGKDRKSTRLNSSHSQISYAVFCLQKKKRTR